MNILDKNIKENAEETLKPINEISFFPGVKASAARTNDGIGALKNGEAIVANNVKSNSGDDDDGDVAECRSKSGLAGKKDDFLRNNFILVVSC